MALKPKKKAAAFSPDLIMCGGNLTVGFGLLEGRLHPGVVVEGSAGTRPAEVRSSVSGVVEFTGGAANCVAVRDERAQLHQLANLQSIRVKLGQRVGAGEVVGAASKAYYQVSDASGIPLDPATQCRFASAAGGPAADGDDPGDDSDDDVGDPPGSEGSSSLGGGGSQPGGGPYPPPPPGGLPWPPPGDDEPPDDGDEPADDDDEPALLSTYSGRLGWLDSAAGGFTGQGPGPAQARRVTGAAARALASRLDLVALTAAEAEGLGQELLARLEGKKTASSTAKAAAMASYVERARAVRAAAETLANQAESLATRMEGN